MLIAHITVKNKIAVGDGSVFVCGNSDYVVEFTFDAEWDAYNTKTARFVTKQGYQDVIFSGNRCEIPILSNTKYVFIGVFAGDLHTTTAAKFTVRLSISCENGPPANPSDDVYNQLMEKLNNLTGGGSGGITEIPIASEDTLGGIKVGENLTITDDGVLSAVVESGGITEIPVATEDALGGIKVGENLIIDENGVLSAIIPEVEFPEIPETPVATTDIAGVVKVGENLTITEDGVLSAVIPEVEIPEIPEIEPTNYFEGVRETDESDSDAIARIVGTEELNDGDVCIVKTLIADSKWSYIAFVYTSNVWMAMDGNVDATNVYFAEDITLAGSYTQVGNVTKKSSETGTLSVAGKSLKDAFQAIFTKELNPTASQPSVSFNSVSSGAKEVGASVTPSWNAKLNAGSYTYGPATGITASSWEISDTDGNKASAASGSFPAITVGDKTSYKITAKAGYGQGAMPVTNLGNDYPSVRIAAGSKSATSSAITGFRAYFYGTSTTPIASTSAAIRGLTNSGKAAAATNWDLTIPEGTKYVYVAVHVDSGKSLSKVEDTGAFGTDIVGSFKETTVSVEGVNGYTAANYKLYTYDTNGVALPANTYKIYLA